MKNESGREPFDPHAGIRHQVQELYARNDRLAREYARVARNTEVLVPPVGTPEHDEFVQKLRNRIFADRDSRQCTGR